MLIVMAIVVMVVTVVMMVKNDHGVGSQGNGDDCGGNGGSKDEGDGVEMMVTINESFALVPGT